MEEECCGRRIEWAIRSPKFAVREEPFFGELLVQPCMCKGHSKDVSDVAQGDEGRKRPCACAVAEDVAEEEPGDQDIRASYLVFGHGSEIRDVGKDVQDCDAAYCQRSCYEKRAAWVADF